MSVPFGSQGADTAASLSNAYLDKLLQRVPKCKFVGRYLNRLQGYHDELTSSEISRICSRGLEIFSYYEERNSSAEGGVKGHIINNPDVTGKADAQDAIALAKAIKQPTKTPIYLAVDFDFTDTATYDKVIKYFQAAYNVFSSSSYYLGVYGNGLLCHHIYRDHSGWGAYLCFSDTPGWADPDMFASWNIRQYGQGDSDNDLGGFSIDLCETDMLTPGSWKL